MLKIMKNTLKILTRQKSIFVGIIVIPTILTLLFSFLLGSEMSYSIGYIDNDNSIYSKDLLETIKKSGTVSLREVKLDTADSSIVGKEVELVIIIHANYEENILSGKDTLVDIKSVTDSEIKSTLSSIVDSKTLDYYSISKIAKGDSSKLSELLDDLNNSSIKYELNDINEKGVNVGASIGMVIMVIFTTSFFITKFIIVDETQGTKNRILLGKVSRLEYYAGTLLVFFLLSALTSLLYFGVCNLLGFDFGTDNSIYYLYVLFALNFLSIAFNLALISVTKSPTVASNLASVLITSLSMISGLFWPFSFMPESLQKIGALVPTRWAMVAIENIQKNSDFLTILPSILSIILVGIILLLITVFFQFKKFSFKK
ncbi:MAG: ABC transporter permease [Clostridium sp.]